MAERNDGDPGGDNLSAYRAKRSPDSSPEPVGSVSGPEGRLFVVHKHAARRLHFDLRLEMDGVLRSWAVPRGPSYDPADKRLAVNVEDHPLEYGDFEGVIPAGNYGAGGVIVWDRGEWVPLEDWRTGLEKGKLLFELRGLKLRGRWTLVKIKKSERDWLLIKERDEWVRQPGDDMPQGSVLSGLTVEEIRTGHSLSASVRDAVAATPAPRSRVNPRSVRAMLAEPAAKAFTREGWLFELKLDGYRLIAAKRSGEVLLLTRNGNDYTSVFPEVARAIRALPLDDLIVDGEVVVMDPDGKPSFSRLQQRGRLSSAMEIRRASAELAATYFVFDFIAFEDFDLRPLPLTVRKKLLSLAFPSLGVARVLDYFERDGERFLERVEAIGLEGIVAKRSESAYRGGRSDAWLKIKCDPTADFVIVGFTAPRGSRGHLGALQLGDYVDGALVYAGRAGTGFGDAQLADLSELLAPIVRETPACAGPVAAPGQPPAREIPEIRTTTWVEPIHVCEVRFREWTPDGLLRHPTFLGLRPDKRPSDCERQGWSVQPEHDVPEPDGGAPSDAPSSPALTDAPEPRGERATSLPERTEGAASLPERAVALSNLHKVYWPAEGYTKGDLIEYYRSVARWMLPYLRNRPLVLTRFPDGIDGKSFYQKDAPDHVPSWIRTTPIWSEETQREIRYFVCDDIETLTYVANMGSIPLHIWASRVGSLETPDWCVMDLDPKDAPFADVIRTAIALRKLCESIALPAYVKTTGKTGLHIMIPLGRQCTYAQSRALGELLARVVLAELSDIATITRHVRRRGDKVYLDYLQNRHGQTIVAPFSVRPLPGATVSMPLLWDEVDSALDPRAFTIRTAIDRMDRMGSDPVLGAIEEKPDLGAILKRLSDAMPGYT